MNLPTIEYNLYTNKKADWIVQLDEKQLVSNKVSPRIINLWLSMNDRIRVQVRFLDKYCDALSTKMFISLAWSIIPKTAKMPFRKFIKKKINYDSYDFIFKKIRRQFNLADNDFIALRERLFNAIEKDKVSWFKYYGIEKKYWKEHYINFNLIKEEDAKEKVIQNGLDKWGL